jgi:hypothetical protein
VLVKPNKKEKLTRLKKLFSVNFKLLLTKLKTGPMLSSPMNPFGLLVLVRLPPLNKLKKFTNKPVNGSLRTSMLTPLNPFVSSMVAQ